MKYKIGQQYREYYSEEAYLTYTIIAMNNNYATLSVTHPNGDKVDAEVLGYIPDANGNIAVFPTILEYMDYIGMEDPVLNLKEELVNCIAVENYGS